jgi:hypothetical protein
VGVFKAPVTGQYRLRLASDDSTIVKMDPADFTAAFDSASMTEVCRQNNHTGFRDYFKYYTYDDPTTCRIDLTADQYYFIHIWGNQVGGPGYHTVSMEVPDQVRDPPRENTKPLVSEIKITNNYVPEILQVKIMNATGGTFKILMQEKNDAGNFIVNFLTEEIPFDASASTFRSKIREKYNYWYMTVVKEMLDASGSVTEVDASQVGSLYTMTFTRKRPHSALPFLLIADLQGSGIVTDSVRTQENSDALSGNYVLDIGGETVDLWYSDNDQTIT